MFDTPTGNFRQSLSWKITTSIGDPCRPSRVLRRHRRGDRSSPTRVVHRPDRGILSAQIRVVHQPGRGSISSPHSVFHNPPSEPASFQPIAFGTPGTRLESSPSVALVTRKMVFYFLFELTLVSRNRRPPLSRGLHSTSPPSGTSPPINRVIHRHRRGGFQPRPGRFISPLLGTWTLLTGATK